METCMEKPIKDAKWLIWTFGHKESMEKNDPNKKNQNKNHDLKKKLENRSLENRM